MSLFPEYEQTWIDGRYEKVIAGSVLLKLGASDKILAKLTVYLEKSTYNAQGRFVMESYYRLYVPFSCLLEPERTDFQKHMAGETLQILNEEMCFSWNDYFGFLRGNDPSDMSSKEEEELLMRVFFNKQK